MAGDSGGNRAQCPARLALRVQRVSPAAGSPARAEPRPISRSSSAWRRWDSARGMNLAPYVYGLASSPLLVLLCAAVSTARHRARRHRRWPDPARHRIRGALRRRWRRGVHPRPADGEPGGDEPPRPGEWLPRQSASRRRHDRRACLRLVHSSGWRTRRAGGSCRGPGLTGRDQRVAHGALRRHARRGDPGAGAGGGRAPPGRVLATVAHLLPGGIGRAHGAQSGRRHHHGLWRRDRARGVWHDVHHGHHRRRAPRRAAGWSTGWRFPRWRQGPMPSPSPGTWR